MNMVGISLHPRNTTLVGKFMEFNDQLLSALEPNKHKVKAGYSDIDATRFVSFAMYLCSINEQNVTLKVTMAKNSNK